MQPDRMRTYTYAEYFGWDDDQRWELIEGKPFAMSAPGTLHQMLLTELLFKLRSHFAGRPCRVMVAPVDVKLSDHDVVQPDLLVVCDPSQMRSTHVEGAPRLVVEILSSSTERHDRVRKMNLYGRTGVEEYWIVNPHLPYVEVYRNEEGLYKRMGTYTDEDVLRSPAFPELHLDLSEVFAELPPQPPIDEVREGTPPYAAAHSS